MGNIFTVETDLIWTRITKMPWKIALSASGNLGSTFDINLVFAEPQIVWYGFYYTDVVVPQTVINIWGEGMFSPLIVQYLAEKS